MRKITRKSDHIKAIGPSFTGTAYCPNCSHKLREMKGNSFNLKCWECGEETPIKAVKFETTLSQVDTGPSVIVQTKKWKRGSGREREKNPLEQELINRGLTVITSDWRDQK